MPSLVSIILIYNSYGEFALLSLFLILWTADSGAYFVGSKMGKRKLAPRVSPGKSIEGLLGGIFSVVLLSIILLMSDLLPFDSFLFVFISAVTGIISVLEIYLKALSNEKHLQKTVQIYCQAMVAF